MNGALFVHYLCDDHIAVWFSDPIQRYQKMVKTQESGTARVAHVPKKGIQRKEYFKGKKYKMDRLCMYRTCVARSSRMTRVSVLVQKEF